MHAVQDVIAKVNTPLQGVTGERSHRQCSAVLTSSLTTVIKRFDWLTAQMCVHAVGARQLATRIMTSREGADVTQINGGRPTPTHR